MSKPKVIFTSTSLALYGGNIVAISAVDIQGRVWLYDGRFAKWILVTSPEAP